MPSSAVATGVEAKVLRAQELSVEAERLADLSGQNPIRMGMIAKIVQDDPSLWELAGARSYDAWMKTHFGKKAKSAYKWRFVVERLISTGFATEQAVLAWGAVKAFEMSRLPESELRTQEWQASAFESDTATFKAKIDGFLASRPDHIEPRFWIHIAMPMSAKNIYVLALQMAEQIAEKEGDPTDSKPVLLERVLGAYVLDHQDMVDPSKLNLDDTGEEDSEGR